MEDQATTSDSCFMTKQVFGFREELYPIISNEHGVVLQCCQEEQLGIWGRTPPKALPRPALPRLHMLAVAPWFPVSRAGHRRIADWETCRVEVHPRKLVPGGIVLADTPRAALNRGKLGAHPRIWRILLLVRAE